MKKSLVLLSVLALMVMAVMPTFAQDEDPGTIADLVVASSEGDMPEFTYLLTAVQAADPAVLEALSDPEAELTVFAPTDAAFEALFAEIGEEAVAELLADPDALTAILLYHVVDGAIYSEDVVALLEETEGGFSVPTLLGQSIDVMAEEDGSITLDGATLNLEMIDIEASNGVIHVIDAVLLPETRTIAEIAGELAADEEDPEFTYLMAAVEAADPAVAEALSNPDAELTVFAPTDAAFEVLGEDTINAVLADQAFLTDILLYHVIDGAVYSGDLLALLEEAGEAGLEVETMNGATVTFSADDEGVYINDAAIVVVDVDAANGVIHVIDAVILPPSE